MTLFKIALVASICFTSFFAEARVTRPGSSRETSYGSLWGKKHFLSLVLDNWKYEEPGLMEDSGLLYGFNYAFKDSNGYFYYEANAEYIFGETTYDGRDNNGPVTADANNSIFMGQLWAGMQLVNPGGAGFIPKVGILFRRLVDENDPGGGDYQRDQDYFAIPVGLDILIPAGAGKLAFTGFVTVFFQGKNTTHWPDVGGDANSQFKQDDGNGFEIGASYLQGMWHGGFFIRTWKVEESDTDAVTFTNPAFNGTYVEPENETFSIGFKGGVAF